MSNAHAQNLYFAGNSVVGYAFGQVNMTDCSYCVEFEIDFFTIEVVSDVVALSNGNIVVIGESTAIHVYDPPSNVPLAIISNGGATLFSGTLAPNGNIYITGQITVAGVVVGQVYEFNPTTNTLSLWSTLPPNQALYELFLWNGQWYGILGTDINNSAMFSFVSVQLGPPVTTTTLYSYANLCGGALGVIPFGPNAGIYTNYFDANCTGSEFFTFDISTNSSTFVCEMGGPGYPYGLSTIPPGFPPPPANCACATEAGQLIPAPLTNICVNTAFTFSNATQTFLDNNDVLQYILFTNPNDTTGSIVAISSTPNFSFTAGTLQTGVTYYVAAMAGNNNGGNIDLTDPCLDFSNALEVIWRPLPTVNFSALGGTGLCAGECRTITASFTGSPPFNLGYSTPNQVYSQVFPANTGSFQLCAPVGSPAGSLQVQAVSLVDEYCTCN